MTNAQIEAMIAEQVAIQVAAALAPPPPPEKPKPAFFSGTVSFYVSHVHFPLGEPRTWGMGLKADVAKAYGVENDAVPYGGEYAFNKAKAFETAKKLAVKFDLPVRIFGWRDEVPETSDCEEIHIVQIALARDHEHRNERIREWTYAGKVAPIFAATKEDLITEFKELDQ
jgi:hypothetical protein